jgi:hypothetical protein
MSLTNPNPINKRLEDYDSKLFKIDISKEYKAYSRICPSNVRRQPVILTDEEKEYIDKYHKGSYEEAIKYGSDPNNQNWFICPRYWSLKDNVSLTQEQVDSGKYGKIIQKDAKKVPPGGNIYEFTDDKYHIDKKGNYVQHYPGFVKEDSKHPHNLCIPCCFKLWNTPVQEQRRKQCLINTTNETIKIKKNNKQIDDYIKGPDKFPLDINRWGVLPLSVQKLLQFNNKDCFNGSNIKSNQKCILRNGVEYSINQSFIACIANVFSEYNDSNVLSIENMKKKIISAIDLDFFVKLNNGNLITIFTPKVFDEDVDIDKYSDSKIFKILNEKDKSLLKKIINSYINYLNFLNSDVLIDYKYLWDVISFPNPELFSDGMNLLIIDIESDDITNDIKIICPEILFSNNFYDETKKLFIVLKKNNFYEPVYIYSTNQIRLTISKLFNLSNKLVLPKLKFVLEKILMQQNNLCLSKNNNKAYNFDKNLDINKLINIISKKYEILYLIYNFNNKIIGIVINIDSQNQFIPCYPSVLINELDYTHKSSQELYELNVLNDYDNTIKFLNEIYDLNNSINVKPVIKIVEDEQVVGILTNSNQFVPLKGPENIKEDTIKVLNDNDYLLADNKIQTSNDVDNDRIKTINFIKLESIFYNLFRNIVKINLSKNENFIYRQDIVNIIKNNTTNYLYNDKLEKINDILKLMLSNSIEFTDYKNNKELMKKLETTTINSIECNNNICDERFCKRLDDSCIIVFPKSNFTTDKDNEIEYYYKIADELIRYSLIRDYILQPNKFMYFNNLTYNINDNELLLFQSSITQDYFDNLDIQDDNIFTTFNIYENTSDFKLSRIKIFTDINYNEYGKQLLNMPTIKDKQQKKLKLLEDKEEQLEDKDQELEDKEEKLEDKEEQLEDKEQELEDKEQELEDKEEQDLKTIQSEIQDLNELECKLNLKKIVGKWKPIFNEKAQELFYFIIKNNEICTFEIIKNMFNDFTNKEHSKANIKNILIDSYKLFIDKNNIDVENIFNVLKHEKKEHLIKSIEERNT